MQRLQCERLEQDLILQIVKQYWRAVAAKKAFEGAKEVLGRVYSQKELYRQKRGLRIISDLVGLSAENRLVDIELDLVRYERLYHEALMELAQSMGVPPSPEFEIVIPEIAFEDIVVANIETLEQTALTHRPELYEKDVEDLVTLDELNSAVLEMFPNLRLFAAPHYDSNFFLLFNTWYEIGLQTAWDLLSLPWRYKHRDVVLQQRELVRKQRIATALAVLTQVNLANLMLKDYIREYEVAREAFQVKSELAEAFRKRWEKGLYSEAETLIYDSDAYFAGIRLLESYAHIQSSIEQLNNAMGIPLYYRADKPEETEICIDSY